MRKPNRAKASRQSVKDAERRRAKARAKAAAEFGSWHRRRAARLRSQVRAVNPMHLGGALQAAATSALGFGAVSQRQRDDVISRMFATPEERDRDLAEWSAEDARA